MTIDPVIQNQLQRACFELFQIEMDHFELQETRKDFEGDLTVVIFPILKFVKASPASIGEQLGQWLQTNQDEVTGFNVVSGFLNLVFDDSYFVKSAHSIFNEKQFGIVTAKSDDKAVIVEYSSPNTNKPLHLGHIRNNLLGYSVAAILQAAGKKVYKTQIINDRGIHICKSMLAWQRFGNGETPENTGLKGDKVVGNYYVRFDQEYKKEVAELVTQGHSEDEAKKMAPILLAAQDMLRQWESGDQEVVELWKTMNQWVYKGFEMTYDKLGVNFDSYYYESETYLLGKSFVEEGLSSGVFVRKEDGSVWCDLTEDGLDEKIVLRSDGTAVYMTQDIGTAIQRIKDYPNIGGMVYTVGNEQDYHFKVLFLILKKFGFEWANSLHHLSYGMVDLPSGKMKSREGTVVDADDLIDEMTATAKTIAQELGKLDGYADSEKEEVYEQIGLGALKYYILKVDPKKRILFDPKESIDFQGNTGPFIQYTHARISAIVRKASESRSFELDNISLELREKNLIKDLMKFPNTVQLAAEAYSPALLANYLYDLVKSFNALYQNVAIFGNESSDQTAFLVELSNATGLVIKRALGLLGIEAPERM
ncbi:MAG: arginine--tRNA ligase [Bacteroidetes bacterium]|nr:arginine--tRNA ligase [Bacteroidota bacterium]MDA0879660.1 arginine--tRNA ligase [Bacteroidota bacterium]MDA1116194.1 arginine--tRNA ligase [Bacteroidota bacterium]